MDQAGPGIVKRVGGSGRVDTIVVNWLDGQDRAGI